MVGPTDFHWERINTLFREGGVTWQINSTGEGLPLILTAILFASLCVWLASRFSEHLVLLTTDELDQLRLLGPEPLSEETRRRVGDYAAISMDATVFRYTGGFDEDHFMHQRSHHSGLSPRELTVPMVVG